MMCQGSSDRRGLRLVKLPVVLLLSAYWIVIFAGTHVPGTVLGGSLASDKLVHFAAYAGLGFLLASVINGLQPSWRRYLLAGIILACYGVVDELGQIPIPGRTAELGDLVADGLGAATGLTAHRLVVLVWRLSRIGRPSPAAS
jgi:VanZ family protein